MTEVVTGFGERGVRAEDVACGVADATQRYLAAGVPVGEHLADQLVLLMALAGSGTFRTLAPSLHTRTNIAAIQSFLDVEISAAQEESDVWRIEVRRKDV